MTIVFNSKYQSIKSMFATVSAIAMIAGSSSNTSFAATSTTTANNAIIGGTNAGLDGIFVNGNNVLIGAPDHTSIGTGAPITFGLGGVDPNSNAGVNLILNHAVQFPHAVDFGSANGGLASITVNASGSNFQQGVTGNLTITSGTITLGGGVKAGGGNPGNVTLNGNDAVINGLTTVAGNLSIKRGVVNQDGAISGDVSLTHDNNDSATLNGTANTNISGKLEMSGAGSHSVKINNVTGDVLVLGGALEMKAAGANVTLNGNGAVINGLTTVGGDLSIKRGVVNQDGIISGSVSITRDNNDFATLNAENSNISGKLEVSTGSHIVKVNNVTDDVNVGGGQLSMNNAASNATISDTIVNKLGSVGKDLSLTT